MTADAEGVLTMVPEQETMISNQKDLRGGTKAGTGATGEVTGQTAYSEPSVLELYTSSYWMLCQTRRGLGTRSMPIREVIANFRQMNFWATVNLFPKLAQLCWQEYLGAINGTVCRRKRAPKVSNLLRPTFPTK